MGLADRPYLRTPPPRSGGGRGPVRLPVWSVTTWIILVCVTIFVVDGFLPIRHIPVGDPTYLPQVNRERLDERSVRQGREVVGEIVGQDRAGRPVRRQVVRRELVVGPDDVVVGYRSTRPMRTLESFMYFSTARLINGIEYWRVISFQFLHAHSTLAHLLFNMLGLFFFGPLVERHLGGKRYLAFYLICGIAGAMLYLLLNVTGLVVDQLSGGAFRLPGLLPYDIETPLIGASAGVFGILMAGAFLAPNARVLLFFILPMRLSTLAYALVVVSLVSVLLSLDNAGGHAAHLGGALAGWYLIRRPAKLHDFFDVLGRLDPTSRSSRAGRADRAASRAVAHSPDEIDRILDKIKEEGIQSLDDRERAALRDASGRG